MKCCFYFGKRVVPKRSFEERECFLHRHLYVFPVFSIETMTGRLELLKEAKYLGVIPAFFETECGNPYL